MAELARNMFISAVKLAIVNVRRLTRLWIKPQVVTQRTAASSTPTLASSAP